jgi:hypothetical protein
MSQDHAAALERFLNWQHAHSGEEPSQAMRDAAWGLLQIADGAPMDMGHVEQLSQLDARFTAPDAANLARLVARDIGSWQADDSELPEPAVAVKRPPPPPHPARRPDRPAQQSVPPMLTPRDEDPTAPKPFIEPGAPPPPGTYPITLKPQDFRFDARRVIGVVAAVVALVMLLVYMMF